MKDILASFIFLTRLPFWRICEVPAQCYKHVVAYWSLVGWLTGGIMAGSLWLSAQVLPIEAAWVVAIVARMLTTGCLHEDGLADFFDGFGGGTSRSRILEIMKDSRIGTYGVVGLIFYYLLLYQMHSLPLEKLIPLCFCADTYTKFVCSHIINILPYARREQESKAKVVYSRMNLREIIIGAIFGLAPIIFCGLWIAAFAPIVSFILLCLYMRKKINGYTGDCVGALFLISELLYLLTSLAIWN